MGLVFGFGLSYFLRRNESFTKTPLKQSSLLLLTAYSAYLISELLNISGIISLFTCSIVMGHYGYRNLSKESQQGTLVAFDAVGYLAEAFVYAYLGICILTISGQWQAIIMAILVIITLPLSRAIAVYILPLFYVIVGKQFPMTSEQTNICFYAGLIRGAIAFALSLQIQSPNKEFIRTVTLLLVLVTTMCGSVSLKAFMKNFHEKNRHQPRLNSNGSSDRPTDNMREIELRKSRISNPDGSMHVGPVVPHNSELRQRQEGHDSHLASDHSLASQSGRWNAFQSKYITPVFTRTPSNEDTKRSTVREDATKRTSIVDSTDSTMKMRPIEQ